VPAEQIPPHRPARGGRAYDGEIHAFPDPGQMKPEQQEIERLRREVVKLKAERDILKMAAAFFAKEAT
jgi:transposase-like protein